SFFYSSDDHRALHSFPTRRSSDLLSRVDSQELRLVSVTDDGYHPSAYDHSVLQKMPDPCRPWPLLEWIRMIDYYHACQYVQRGRSEEHTSELQSRFDLVCRLLLEK